MLDLLVPLLTCLHVTDGQEGYPEPVNLCEKDLPNRFLAIRLVP